LLGKSFDTFAPIGPWIVTADELDHRDLSIRMRINGVTRQSSSTRHLVFPVDYLVSHLSQFCTLFPGDLIFTGTPAGVGAGQIPPAYLSHDDVMEVEISGIGTLRNRVRGMPARESTVVRSGAAERRTASSVCRIPEGRSG
jgi:2-keto-4-pentenoate hydratase/2-oxohepta-3-ene-1,7-dioic acid hydratase in catechol pathway